MSATWTATSSPAPVRPARRPVPLPRRSSAWTVMSPGRASVAASRSSCAAFDSVPCRSRQRERPVARHPPADACAAGAGELAGPLAGEQRADGVAAKLAAGRAREGVQAQERPRDLEPGQRRAAVGGEGLVAGVHGAGRAARSPPPGPGPRAASGRPTTAASATAGCASRTASTSAGAMFSPPRTMRSSRRSTTNRRPSPSRRPRSPVRTGPVAGAAGPGRRGSRRSAPRSRRRSPPPHPRPAHRWSATRPGADGRRIPGARAASAVGRAVAPEPVSDRPYVGTTGQPARTARVTSAGGIGPPPSRTARSEAGAGRRRRRPAAGRAAPGRARRGSSAAAPPSAARMAAGSARPAIRTGTRPAIARHRIPRPAT